MKKISKIPIVPDVPNVSVNEESSENDTFVIDSEQIFLSF